MFLKKLNVIVVLVTIIIQYAVNIQCVPIDVTGTNIKYYKLTPNEGSGNYNFNYGTHDGSQRSERGFVKKEEGSGRPLLTVTGTFKYEDADGELHEVCYIADEQGYRIVTQKELDEFHDQLKSADENEIVPANTILSPTSIPQPQQQPFTTSSHTSSSSSVVPDVQSSSSSHISALRASLLSSLPPPPPTPTTESQIIKLKVIKPADDKSIVCAPGKCIGERQSKIFKIKSLKIG